MAPGFFGAGKEILGMINESLRVDCYLVGVRFIHKLLACARVRVQALRANPISARKTLMVHSAVVALRRYAVHA